MFFGCGTVAAAVLTGAQVGVFQIAIVWGLGVAIAIHLTSSLSGAHLNPAVTLAMAAWRKFPLKQIAPYIVLQMLGSFAAAAVVYVIFRDAFSAYEMAHGVARGSAGSEATAMVFGEFFPSPGGRALTEEARGMMSHGAAFAAEVIGTSVLALVIFCCTDERNEARPQLLTASLIGLTVTMLISILGPLTMACFNPARDLAPRVFSALAGWGSVPFETNGLGWLTVYVVAPIVGAQLGGAVYALAIRRLYALPLLLGNE